MKIKKYERKTKIELYHDNFQNYKLYLDYNYINELKQAEEKEQMALDFGDVNAN